MALTVPLQAARELYQTKARLVSAGVLAARQARSNPDRLMSVVVAFQLAAIRAEVDATTSILQEQDIPDKPVAALAPAALAGVASDGRNLGSLLTLPDLTGYQFDRIVATQLQDVARQAAAVERAVRPNVTHYVRAVNLPACGRCIILAGRPQASETAFRRHPMCDCSGVMTTARYAARMATDAREAFEQMGKAEREKAFTKAGAEAIRLGADPVQVVNARRGMVTAQGSMELRGHTQRRKLHRGYTDETVAKTAYHSAGRAARNADGLYITREGVSSRRGRRQMAESMRAEGVTGDVRLMPESIMQIASTDAERLRLLRAYGYIRP